jgi:hypothetical protein
MQPIQGELTQVEPIRMEPTHMELAQVEPTRVKHSGAYLQEAHTSEADPIKQHPRGTFRYIPLKVVYMPSNVRLGRHFLSSKKRPSLLQKGINQLDKTFDITAAVLLFYIFMSQRGCFDRRRDIQRNDTRHCDSRHNDTRYCDIQHDDIQHNNKNQEVHTITYSMWHSA